MPIINLVYEAYIKKHQYPLSIDKTNDMVYDIDFSWWIITDKCWLSITNNWVTTLNEWDNYIWVLNWSSQINLNSTTVYSPSTAMFYSMWLKISVKSWRVLDLHNWYSEMLITFASSLNWYIYGREEANRWGHWNWQEAGFNLNDWHLVQMWYDGSSTTYLYVDWEYKSSVTNNYSWYGNTWTWQMIWSSNGSGYITWYIGQCYARTTRPSDAEILNEYNLTKPVI